MVHDAPPSVTVDVPTVTLPVDAVVRLLNVLEALVPTQGGLPAPQTTSQEQAQVQLNVAAPQIAPQQVVQPVANTGQSKDLKNFIDLKPLEFDATQVSIEPQKFIQRCEKILSTLGLKETRGVEFATFLFSGFAESWWNSVKRAMFMDRFVPLSKRDDMRRQFEQLRQGSMIVTEYEAKFTNLASYAPFLVADEHEKVRRFVDGLEHRYRGSVVRDVRDGSYEESRPTQSESVVQSSRSTYPARQGQQQTQRKDNDSYQPGQHPRCSNCGRNHSGRCFGTYGACFTCGQKGHIAKYCPRGYSATSHATPQPQRTFTGTQAQTQPTRAAPQVARG
uniref:Uncharacterized protein LOC104243805 n=1 Tax=Nicotiana sylvestris TaxID=4096 RepID=A0A1U7YDP1_NICSY|nr:PREDICTED: uncharacterized protein LOC104243805 [Nicotiana sylvestris]